jgi:5-methylcytosine-specific restriction endonuclease McrA
MESRTVFVPKPIKVKKPKKKRREKWKDLATEEFYTSFRWLKLRFEVLKAYGAVCMLCADTGHIVVDHIKPRSKYPALELDFENMQVLCNKCNRGKGAHDETDFRPKTPEPELRGDELQHWKTL